MSSTSLPRPRIHAGEGGRCPPLRGRAQRFIRSLASFALAACVGAAQAFAADDLKAFPPADEGMVRHVIELPRQDDEAAFKVELLVGKTVRTDASNRYFFGGTLEAVPIPGWGYERYVLRQLGPMAGTLMAPQPDAPQVDRFITLGGEPRLLRYNSRLPLVVYVPAGVEVRHRVWRAESGPRQVLKLALPGQRTAVVAEGDGEARSIGSYSVRLYSTENAQPGDDTTFFLSGVVRARDGTLESVSLAELARGGPPSLIVTIRSAGSGGYVSADAFDVGAPSPTLVASVAGLAPGQDPVEALKASARDAGAK